jgi:hypothetical protein
MIQKKKVEREYLNSFRFLCPDFPDGELEEDREAPDFVVIANKKRIGIEVARIYKTDGSDKKSLQAIEATKEAITIAAKCYAESWRLSPAYVALFFNLREPANKRSVENIALNVARVVRENMPPEGKSIEVDYARGRRQGQPREVDLIWISRSYPYEHHEWDWPEAGFVKSDAIQLFEERIREKSAKLSDYLRECDECWLLIVAPSFKPSGMIHPDAHSFSYRYNSPFSRTYFLDFGRGSVAELS